MKWERTQRFWIPMPGGGTSDSAAMCADGRVAYMNVQGGDIRQGWADSVADFYDDNSVKNAYTMYTKTNPNCCIFNGANGVGLYALVGWMRNPANAETLCLVSPSGNGGDWAQRALIDSSGTGGNWINTETSTKMIGQPYITAGGRWVATFYRLQVQFGITYKWQAVWTSDNQGTNWTLQFSRGFYIVGGPYGYFQSRNIAPSPVDGRLWWACEGQPEGGCISYSFNSDGGGAVEHFNDSLGSRHNYMITDTEYIYRMTGDGAVYKSADPTANVWEFVYQYPLAPGNKILQVLRDRYALMSDGRLIDPMPLMPPWLRQRQRDDANRVNRKRNNSRSIQTSASRTSGLSQYL